MRSIIYNIYAISHLFNIIIITMYYTNILQHNITLFIPIVILAYHTRLQIKFLFILPNLKWWYIVP